MLDERSLLLHFRAIDFVEPPNQLLHSLLLLQMFADLEGHLVIFGLLGHQDFLYFVLSFLGLLHLLLFEYLHSILFEIELFVDYHPF